MYFIIYSNTEMSSTNQAYKNEIHLQYQVVCEIVLL